MNYSRIAKALGWLLFESPKNDTKKHTAAQEAHRRGLVGGWRGYWYSPSDMGGDGKIKDGASPVAVSSTDGSRLMKYDPKLHGHPHNGKAVDKDIPDQARSTPDAAQSDIPDSKSMQQTQPKNPSAIGPDDFKDDLEREKKLDKIEKENNSDKKSLIDVSKIINQVPSADLTDKQKQILRKAEFQKIQSRLTFTVEQEEKEDKQRLEELRQFQEKRNELFRLSRKGAGKATTSQKFKGKYWTLDELRRKCDELSTSGVGLGTGPSRSGECAVVTSLLNIKSEVPYNYKESIDDYNIKVIHYIDTVVKNKLLKLTQKKGIVLTKDWVDSAIASTHKIIEEIGGAQNIQEVVWDTPEGRHLVNVNKHGTSSDMFVLTRTGERVGISLKKNGQVFLNNGGLGIQIENISQELLTSGVPEIKVKQFEDNVGPHGFNKEFDAVLDTAKEDTRKHLNKAFNVAIRTASRNKDLQKILGPKWEKYIQQASVPDFLQRKHWTNDNVKTFARVIDYLGQTNPKAKEITDEMRNVDIRATNRFMHSLQDDQISNSVKNYVLKGIHFNETLGLDVNPNLDKFLTVYGMEPNGASLSQKTLTDLFDDYIPKFGHLVAKAQGGDKKAKEELLDDVKNQLVFDGSSSKGGTIKVKIKNPSPPPPVTYYPLFSIGIRTKGIGTPPAFELVQHTFLANILENGVDIKLWPKQKRMNFYKSQLEYISGQLKKRPSPAERQDLKSQSMELIHRIESMKVK